MSLNRFALRRRRLRRQHLCTRCGSDRAKKGHTLCAGCLAVKSLKAAPLPSEAESRARAEKIARLRRRLELIKEAEAAVAGELSRLAS